MELEPLYLPPLERGLPESGTYDEIKESILVNGDWLEAAITPCQPAARPKFALKINGHVIGYFNSPYEAQNHMHKVRRYYERGGTFTSIIVLANL